MKIKKGSKRFARFAEAASSMPPLPHSKPGERFDIERSEAARWLCSRPETLQLVFDAAKERGLIEYDAETRAWRGSEGA